MQTKNYEYAGFWLRVWATLIDTALTLMITLPLLIAVYGWTYFDVAETGVIAGPADVLINWALPSIAILWFWYKTQATPGKMAISAKIVDATTGEAMSSGQSILRYLGYFVALLPLGLGLLWVAFDGKKQGWHDKLANTVVIRPSRNSQ